MAIHSDNNPDPTRNRLAWQCRRGMRELDEILKLFLERRYSSLGRGELSSIEKMLKHPDEVLLDWLMGRMVPLDKDVANIVREIRNTTAT